MKQPTEFFYDSLTGYSFGRGFSYWPNTKKWGMWSVESDFYGYSPAVIDDFGNLVRVPS